MNEVVEIATGKVRGFKSSNVTVFRGIPYAAPPVGELRFAPPAPVLPWSGVRDCQNFAPVSLQSPTPHHDWRGDGPFLFVAPGVAQSEDCLNLNVWTSGSDGEPRGVLVYIHGGGFIQGSGTGPWFDGSILSASENIVVVTINYRLGLLGSLAVGDDLSTANNAIRDQISALEWVQENIAAFGGDPMKVTVAGESAGAASVAYLLSTPSAVGKFRSVIIESGQYGANRSKELAFQVQRAVYEDLGLTESSDPLNALRGFDAERILGAQTNIRPQFPMPVRPYVDGSLIPAEVLASLAKGVHPGITMLIGCDAEESREFSDKTAKVDFVARLENLTGADRNDAALQEVADLYKNVQSTDGDKWDALSTDINWFRTAQHLVDAHVASGSTAYQYQFAWKTTFRQMGAAHGVVVPFPFGNVRNLGHIEMFGVDDQGEANGRELSNTMMRSWGSFVKYADPNCPELPHWTKYDPANRQQMRFDNESEFIDDPFTPRDEVWLRNFPDVQWFGL